MDLAAQATELLWIGAVTAIPLAIVVSVSCRWPRCRPATRHAMWTAVLLSFITPAVASLIGAPEWVRPGRLIEAAMRSVDRVRAEWSAGEASPATALPGTVAVEPAPTNTPVAPAGKSADRSSVAHSLAPVPKVPQKSERTSPVWLSATDKNERAASSRVVSPILAAMNDESLATLNPPARRVERRDPGRDGVNQRVDAAPSAAAPDAPGSSMPNRQAVAEVVWAEELKEWAAHAVSVRDALAAFPPLPFSVWAAGAVALFAISAARIVVARRVFRHARPASDEVVASVRAAAEEIGLGRVPTTLITGDRVSPMVWCSVRPKLVLPVGLWRELDARSRHAILLHELAHLKRRDHWLCWLAMLVGMIYWWHPIAWWTRKRIRDEADAACDAWVTSLIPASRRAYAEALVTTKWYLSNPGRRLPAGLVNDGALGVMSGRTRHLARRLKMVMTQRVAPRPSMAGAVVALGVLVTGMFVMPSIACPPEHGDKAVAGRVIVVKGQAAKEAKAAKKGKAPQAAAPNADVIEFYGEAPALEAMRREKAAPGTPRPEGGEEEMLRRLEERMRRLEGQLEHLNSRGAYHPAAGSQQGHAAQAAALMERELSLAARARGEADHARAGAKHAYTVAGRSLGTLNTTDTVDVVREYTLPDGKRKALVDLMIRDDVPVLIVRHPSKLVVQAPESKQRIVAAFVALIHPESKAENAVVHGQSLGQVREIRGVQKQQIEEMRRQMKDMERQRLNADREAERARRRSETVEEEVEEIREHIEEIRSSEEGRADASGLEAKVRGLVSQLDAKSSELASFVAEAAAREEMGTAIENAIEQIEEAIENLAEQIEDEIESMVEESMNEVEVEEMDDPFGMTRAVAPAPFSPPAAPGAPAPLTPAAAPGRLSSPLAPLPPMPPARPGSPTPPVPPAPTTAVTAPVGGLPSVPAMPAAPKTAPAGVPAVQPAVPGMPAPSSTAPIRA